MSNVSILAAGAEELLLRDGLVDVIHSRFAYFFGPERGFVRSCAPGMAQEMQEANDTFYREQGFECATVESVWAAPDLETLRRVLAMEFPGAPPEEIIGTVIGAEMSYHYRVYYRQK